LDPKYTLPVNHMRCVSSTSFSELIRYIMMEKEIVSKVKHWVERVVIGLDLCPFAEREYSHQRVFFIVSEANSEEALLSDLQTELIKHVNDPAIETTLLIHPYVLESYEDYNQFLALADELLKLMELDMEFQIAGFHPDYQFAEYSPNDVENYTNRSPYPMLHILRERSLDEAIDSHPDIHDVPLKNKERLRQMGIEKLRKILNAF